jgi:hypothetical protein
MLQHIPTASLLMSSTTSWFVVGLQQQQPIGISHMPICRDENTAPDGIWYGSTALSRDVATIVRRMKLLGFNAVRLPFSFSDL